MTSRPQKSRSGIAPTHLVCLCAGPQASCCAQEDLKAQGASAYTYMRYRHRDRFPRQRFPTLINLGRPHGRMNGCAADAQVHESPYDILAHPTLLRAFKCRTGCATHSGCPRPIEVLGASRLSRSSSYAFVHRRQGRSPGVPESTQSTSKAAYTSRCWQHAGERVYVRWSKERLVSQ